MLDKGKTEELLWSLLNKSKDGKAYLDSDSQYDNLKKLLSVYNFLLVEDVHKVWIEKRKELTDNQEFEKLHVQNGGIISSGDDGFYMDFAYWVLAQGEDLFKEFKDKGHTAIIDYINKHSVSESDYMFECMAYAFHDFI